MKNVEIYTKIIYFPIDSVEVLCYIECNEYINETDTNT